MRNKPCQALILLDDGYISKTSLLSALEGWSKTFEQISSPQSFKCLILRLYSSVPIFGSL
ncbi:hypothetical protein MASR1M31_20830 [Porphyromonadaceae bacterium]